MRVLGLILLAVLLPAIGFGLRPADAPEPRPAVAAQIEAKNRRLLFSQSKPRAALPAVAPKTTAPLLRQQAAQPSEKIWTQAQIVVAAARDAATLPAGIACYIRYLDLGNLRPSERPDAVRVLSGHVNSLSREPDIIPLVAVPGTESALVRLNIEDYRWSHIWEKLADDDPYYQTTVETKTTEVVTAWPGGIWPDDGLFYAAGAFKFRDTRKIKSRAIAPWVADTEESKAALSYLISALQSKIPVTRADWFFNRTAIQAGRGKTGYYDFLEIDDEKSFQKLVGFDAKLAGAFAKEMREAVSDSGVTLQPRAIVADNAQGGKYVKTLDFKRATDKKNPLRVLGKDLDKVYDATEQFGHLPNGFWATGLFDGKGKRQDFAPPDIASDHMSRSNDKSVHVNMSCTRCHTQAGMQPVDGWAKNLFQPPLALQGPDYKVIAKLRRQYLRDLNAFLEQGREVHRVAVMEATGMKAEEFHARYGDFFESYEDRKVDLDYAARSIGCEPARLKAAIAQQIRLTGATDLVLSALMLEGPRARRLPIRIWEELVPLAHAAIRGVQLP